MTHVLGPGRLYVVNPKKAARTVRHHRGRKFVFTNAHFVAPVVKMVLSVIDEANMPR